MPIEWGDHTAPNTKCSYDHLRAETPLGPLFIEWKGWKRCDSPTCDLPWNDGFVYGDDLDDAKAKVQAAWDEMVQRMAALK